MKKIYAILAVVFSALLFKDLPVDIDQSITAPTFTPWTVVCDGKGHYQFTDNNGRLFACAGVFYSREGAENERDSIKALRDPYDLFEFEESQVHAIKHWQVCTIPDHQP